MAENEAVDLDLSGMKASLQMAKMNFSHVLFRDTAETYTVGTDIACVYTITSALEPAARDWVGLYKVGWRSPDNYICYEWSPMPGNYVTGKEVENHVTFPANKLPNDDGEFYQFCYINAKKQVRGASSPFQFRKSLSFSSSLDELVEIEDENGELLIVKSKTAFLDEQLKKANEKCSQLKKDIEVVEGEKSLLELNKQELEKRLERQMEEEGFLHQQIEGTQSMVTQLSKEVSSLKVYVSDLQGVIVTLKQEKSELHSSLMETESSLAALNEAKKVLLTDQDNLIGQVKSLQAEKELYQSHFTSSESTVQTYMQKNEELNARLLEKQAESCLLAEQIENMQKELMLKSEEINERAAEIAKSEENMKCLQERVSVVESEILTRDNKIKQSEEQLEAVMEACRKISTDLEVSKTEAEALKIQNEKLKVSHETEKEQLLLQLEEINQRIAVETKDKENLLEEVAKLRQHLEEVAGLVGADSALFAMQAAHASLKQRYFRMEKQLVAQKALHEQTVGQAVAQSRELQQELEKQNLELKNLKERLIMGQELYKEKFIECQQLQEQLRSREKPAAAKGISGPQSTHDESSIITELQQQMKTFGTELDNRDSRLREMETLYMHEKEKCVMAEHHIRQLETDISSVQETLLMALKGSTLMPGEMRTVTLDLTALQGCPTLSAFVGKISKQIVPVTVSDAYAEFAVDNQPTLLDAPVTLSPVPAPMVPQRLYPVVDECDSPPQPGHVVSSDVVEHNTASCHTVDHIVAPAPYAGIERPPESIGEMVTSCPVCSLEFKSDMPTTARLNHIDGHYSEGYGTCPLCNENFPIQNLEEHVQQHLTT